MKLLIVGDVVGRIGRKAFDRYTRELKKKYAVDLVIVNGENSAGGKGISRKSMDELLRGGADIVTSGNHIWDNREIYGFIEDEPYLVRPANYPEGAPGKGWCIYQHRMANVAVINMSGRAFMPEMDCPFQKIEDILAEIGNQADIFVLDFHAETTSEKMAMGFYLDGRVQAVVGTHTHIQTSDARILPNGTGYITDLGMVGPWNSVLGVKPEIIIKKFTTCMPVRFDLAEGPAVYSAVVMDIDTATKKTVGIERILITTNAVKPLASARPLKKSLHNKQS